jgi:hypothetical protein
MASVYQHDKHGVVELWHTPLEHCSALGDTRMHSSLLADTRGWLVQGPQATGNPVRDGVVGGVAFTTRTRGASATVWHMAG